jgi:phosphate:Na+ symporter
MNYGFTDFLQLFGSLGLFLYGMKVMSDALMDLAGDKMRNILASMTSNRVFAVFTGFLITVIIQSSSATTLMVVSFVNASLLTLTEAIGVILGANIGTTITAWLITILGFKVSMSSLALPLVGFGFLATFSKKENLKRWGGFIIGFAILFIGLQFLKDAVPDIKNNPEVLEWLQHYTEMGYLSLLLFLGIGTVLTLVIQSSSATMALTLIMCYEGWIPFDMAAAMVLGENIGTTITANIASLVANHNAKRAARAHLIANVLGVIWMLAMIYPFLRLIDTITQTNGLSAFDSPLAIPVALSAFHTTFNVTNTFFMIWFIPLIEKIVTKMVPEKPEPKKQIDEPKYLDKSSLKYNITLIDALLKESKHLFKNSIFDIIAHGLQVKPSVIKSNEKIKHGTVHPNDRIKAEVDELYYQKVKTIYGKIIEYATKGQSHLKLTEEETLHIAEIKVANRKMVEIIRDIKELSRNISLYVDSDLINMNQQYSKFRKKIINVMRTIYLFRHTQEEDKRKHHETLMELKQKAKASIHAGSESINDLIRKDLISPQMASSLVNDHDNVNDLIKKLISIAELLYAERDPLLDSNIKL